MPLEEIDLLVYFNFEAIKIKKLSEIRKIYTQFLYNEIKEEAVSHRLKLILSGLMLMLLSLLLDSSNYWQNVEQMIFAYISYALIKTFHVFPLIKQALYR